MIAKLLRKTGRSDKLLRQQLNERILFNRRSGKYLRQILTDRVTIFVKRLAPCALPLAGAGPSYRTCIAVRELEALRA